MRSHFPPIINLKLHDTKDQVINSYFMNFLEVTLKQKFIKANERSKF